MVNSPLKPKSRSVSWKDDEDEEHTGITHEEVVVFLHLNNYFIISEQKKWIKRDLVSVRGNI